ncbi:MAG: hypothetical protein Q8P58_01455 [Candidatus Adlerbacteria bacterium]|nr:hypothetical protein [Candidatus Adlerbacteria bacterium]
MPAEQEISWTVMREHRERTNDWYWGLGALATAGALASIFFGNTLLAIILIMGAFSIGVLAAREPREHTVKIDGRGIVIDGTRYPHSSVHSFWVEHETSYPRLFLSMTGIISPHFSFELQDEAQGDRVRTFLRRFVSEEEQGPHIGEHLAELFGL